MRAAHERTYKLCVQEVHDVQLHAIMREYFYITVGYRK
jgi:hypothetical protein